jgi:cyclopropane-fatty-acyl-phospholipid synthase
MTRDYMFEESERLRARGEVPGWRFDPGVREAAE